MRMTLRDAMRLAAGTPAVRLAHGQAAPSIAPGPYEGTGQ